MDDFYDEYDDEDFTEDVVETESIIDDSDMDIVEMEAKEDDKDDDNEDNKDDSDDSDDDSETDDESDDNASKDDSDDASEDDSDSDDSDDKADGSDDSDESSDDTDSDKSDSTSDTDDSDGSDDSSESDDDSTSSDESDSGDGSESTDDDSDGQAEGDEENDEIVAPSKKKTLGRLDELQFNLNELLNTLNFKLPAFEGHKKQLELIGYRDHLESLDEVCDELYRSWSKISAADLDKKLLTISSYCEKVTAELSALIE